MTTQSEANEEAIEATERMTTYIIGYMRIKDQTQDWTHSDQVEVFLDNRRLI